jgi:heat shock transcription factor 1
MYDFHKLRHDTEENEWKHRLFRRGNRAALADIKRKISEGP